MRDKNSQMQSMNSTLYGSSEANQGTLFANLFQPLFGELNVFDHSVIWPIDDYRKEKN